MIKRLSYILVFTCVTGSVTLAVAGDDPKPTPETDEAVSAAVGACSEEQQAVDLAKKTTQSKRDAVQAARFTGDAVTYGKAQQAYLNAVMAEGTAQLNLSLCLAAAETSGGGEEGEEPTEGTPTGSETEGNDGGPEQMP